MNITDAERTVREHIGSPVLQAVVVILNDELEKVKSSLLNLENPDMRGRGQMCKTLVRRFSQNSVDTEE